MKLPQLLSQKKLRASTARRALGAGEMDYEEMSEPNMKLSRALLIVLVLHVVAVAGIIAFNTIKARQEPTPPTSSESAATNGAPVAVDKTESPTAITTTKGDEAKMAKAVPKPLPRDEHPVERAKPVENTSTKPTAARSYVVAKGDSPASIARKFKVPYDDIMEANRIEDPHKLKIGQKLIIPKSTKPKKGDQ
jgi:LysM repeat protein